MYAQYVLSKNIRNIKNFRVKIFIFYNFKNSLYFARACFRNNFICNFHVLSFQNTCRLSDYKIPANSSILLIVPLYVVPENLNHVVFDLSWEFPRVNPDFLDASCLAFNGPNFIQLIDWNHSKNNYYLKGMYQYSEIARKQFAFFYLPGQAWPLLLIVPGPVHCLLLTILTYKSLP